MARWNVLASQMCRCMFPSPVAIQEWWIDDDDDNDDDDDDDYDDDDVDDIMDAKGIVKEEMLRITTKHNIFSQTALTLMQIWAFRGQKCCLKLLFKPHDRSIYALFNNGIWIIYCTSPDGALASISTTQTPLWSETIVVLPVARNK